MFSWFVKFCLLSVLSCGTGIPLLDCVAYSISLPRLDLHDAHTEEQPRHKGVPKESTMKGKRKSKKRSHEEKDQHKKKKKSKTKSKKRSIKKNRELSSESDSEPRNLSVTIDPTSPMSKPRINFTNDDSSRLSRSKLRKEDKDGTSSSSDTKPRKRHLSDDGKAKKTKRIRKDSSTSSTEVSDKEDEAQSTSLSSSSRTSSRTITPPVLQYVEGDATHPIGKGDKIIAHICNTAGGWGKGFVLAISKRWCLPEEKYRSLRTPIELGQVQFVRVADDINVANMVAQTTPQSNGPPPIQYDALRKALKQVGTRALVSGASVHMPKIGSGLSRGNWDKIVDIINTELVHLEIPVFIYLYDPK